MDFASESEKAAEAHDQRTPSNRVDAGARETQRRMERLGTHAEMQANKQLLATQQEMIAEAFNLAAKQLSQLPAEDYMKLLKRKFLLHIEIDFHQLMNIINGYQRKCF